MVKSNSKTELFESMPIRPAVIKQILPAIASQMITLIYNLADTYFVGKLNSPAETAAITVVYPAFLMLTALSNLFGVGGASSIAWALGKKDIGKARATSCAAIWGGVSIGIVYSVLFLLFRRPMLTLCGATAATFDIAADYSFWIIVLGGTFTVMNLTLANLVRAEGSAVSASIGVSLGGILNIILDPIFVLPRFWGLGAVGAGIATAISNVAATAYFIVYSQKNKSSTVLEFSFKHLKNAKEQLKTIVTVGLPSAVQIALTVVAVGAQAKFVSKYATEAIAGLGIAKKLDQLPLYFSIGVSNGMLPILAYNYSSGNQLRRRQAFGFGCMIAVGFSLVCLCSFELFAPWFSRFFISDAKTIDYAAAFLRRMVVAMPLMSICYPMIMQFQTIGRVKAALICSVLRKGVLDIPILFIMDAVAPLYGLMWVQPIVDAISLCVAVFLSRRHGEK